VIRPEKQIHKRCLQYLSPVRQPVCKKCGKEVLGEAMEYCLDCSRHPRTFDSGMAVLNYNKAAMQSMAAIKYKNRREYLDFYAGLADYRFAKKVHYLKPEVLIPVPVHPSRLRRRGFNQAFELARRLAGRWDIPVEGRMLIRTRKTMPQRNLNPGERLKNLQEAFAVAPRWLKRYPVPETVLLVDDIYTTGSTIEACARVLKRAGVKKIYFVTICIGAER